MMKKSFSITLLVWIAFFSVEPVSLRAQAIAGPTLTPNLVGNVAGQLRYRPENGDFVITNGMEFFNRPLYGGNTAFRVDAGDRPEFSLYLPGRGGNLRLGLKSKAETKWLFDAVQIETRYRPGMMVYEIRDPLLGAGVLKLEAIALAATEGLILRAEAQGAPKGIQLVWAFGGASGQRGARDGDIGTEKVPIHQYFQFSPENCRDNNFDLAPGAATTFTLESRTASIFGVTSSDSALAIADAQKWDSWEALASSSNINPHPRLSVVIGHATLSFEKPLYIALQRLPKGEDSPAADLDVYREVARHSDRAKTAILAKPTLAAAFRAEDLARVFEDARSHFDRLREQMKVSTPDPYIDAAVGALNVAADGVWDEPQQAVMHGAVAWRTRLLGWRGQYTMDELGWHDRARVNLGNWAKEQNTGAIAASPVSADEETNLSRSEAALHSNGDISSSHYDMNAVYIDAVFRHLRWTGDLAFAREMWPMIKRHLGWERRLFRRPFGPEALPLYEAYADIWASDNLQYSGGGVAYASAYNAFHFRLAAEWAKKLGEDSSAFEREAQLIERGLRSQLWLADRGWLGEYKDWLGLQQVHPAPGLWTFYHSVDSEWLDPFERWQISRYVDSEIPHLPVFGPGIPREENYHVLATTHWMPYSWSVNNVVMAEGVHASLAFWQSGRSEEAFRLMKGAVLASMYMGICPGNVGSMSYLDVYRRESQRDFADGDGVLARAIVEGLFGIRPDLSKNELLISPGFPGDWTHASLRHPDVDFDFNRKGKTDTYKIVSRFDLSVKLKLQVSAQSDRIDRVTADGHATSWELVENAVGSPKINIFAMPAASHEIAITWSGETIATSPAEKHIRSGDEVEIEVAHAVCGKSFDPQGVWKNIRISAHDVSGAVCGSPGHRTVFVQVQQGSFMWWLPLAIDIKASDVFETTWNENSRLPKSARMETIDLTSFFNDRVTEIFQHEYRRPRSPFASLAIPKQGIGGWAGSVRAQAEIDDRGLREASAENGGRLILPNGIPFATPGPGNAKNISFCSQWDNFPREVRTPLRGQASRLYLLMAGSTNWMQSQFDNGEVIVKYTDGTMARLALHNPTNWWPIDQDYFIDDFQFARPEPIPPRVDLKTGIVRFLEPVSFAGRGRSVQGGAATVLELSLDPHKTLESLTVRALANEVIIGLMAATLVR